VWPREVLLGDPCLELLKCHLPQIRPIVEKLRQASAEVSVLWAGFELDEGQISTVPQKDEIDTPGVEAGLASYYNGRTHQAKFIQWQQLGVQFELLLEHQFLFSRNLLKQLPTAIRDLNHQFARHADHHARPAARATGAKGHLAACVPPLLSRLGG
jgi:hypothetical protein